MSSFSTFGSMMGRGSVNVNSMNYLSKYAKNITNDFSGNSFTDLSATPSYALTAGGLNMTNGNTTFSRLKYNNALLKTTDFAPSSASSFTIYVKHAARYSSLCPFNFQNPNVLKLSTSVVSGGSSFTASFYSSLNPGTTVPYSITGCSSADLSGAAVSGVFTAPYQNTTYSVADGVAGRSIGFDVSGGTVVPTLYIPDVVYTVTVNGGVYWLATGGGAAVQRPNITLGAGLMYVFDQSDASNLGNTLVLGETRDATPYYTTNVVTNGTAGSASAYTLIDLSGMTLPSPALKYFSRNTEGMGQPSVPDAPTIISATAGSTYADISFSAPANNGGSAITLYTATVATLAGDIYTPLGTVFPGTSSPTKIRATGLTNGTTYYFSVFATNAVGTGAATEYSVCSAIPVLGPPDTPAIRIVTDPGSGTRFRFYFYPPDDGAEITKYSVIASRSSIGTDNYADYSTTDLLSFPPYRILVNPPKGYRYKLRIAATNAIGTSAYSSSVEPVELDEYVSDPVNNLSIQSINRGAYLFFSPPTFDGGSQITSYYVEVYNGGIMINEYRYILSTNSKPADFNPSPLVVWGIDGTNGNEYKVRIKVNTYGTWSDFISFIPNETGYSANPSYTLSRYSYLGWS